MQLPIDLGTLCRDDVSVESFDPASDAPALYRALDDPRVWQHIPAQRPVDPNQLAETLTGPQRQTLVIRRYETVVGTTSLLDRTGEAASVEIGATLLSPDVWGSGVNTTAKDLLLSALTALHLEWVLLRTDERNERSARAILKLPRITELPRHSEPDIIRPDGSQRTSRMFRVDLPSSR